MTFQSINPATDEVISTWQVQSAAEISAAIDWANAAYLDWRHTSFAERAELLHRAADLLRARKAAYGMLMTKEMGKPISQAMAEIEKCAGGCDYYADQGANFLSPEAVTTEAAESFVCYEPLGLVLAVMPWNFPFWQVFRFAAPALMAGNGCVLKHAQNVTGCALAIAELLQEGGFPAGLFTSLIASSSSIEAVIANPHIKAVTLTGSEAAGAAVGSLSGRYLKKSVLELGGNDAYVILADADLALAARICCTSRMNNCGQTCIAAKRLIVDASVVTEFEQLLLQELKNYPPGDPQEPTTRVGPMARKDLRQELHQQVLKSIEQGARCLTGGEIPAGAGCYYPPTLLTGVTASMVAFREELFGPVVCIITANNEEEAIALANDSDFGLGAAVFSKDTARAKEIARHRIEAGTCAVNDFVRSDPRLPFGGIKRSGYGRELSHHGIREFVNIKTVYTA